MNDNHRHVSSTEAFEALKKSLEADLRAYGEHLKSKMDPETGHKLSETSKEAEEFIKKHPFLTVILAAVVGFFLARLLYKRND